jgi:hypothetical protein
MMRFAAKGVCHFPHAPSGWHFGHCQNNYMCMLLQFLNSGLRRIVFGKKPGDN